jgi:hypothetical protein
MAGARSSTTRAAPRVNVLDFAGDLYGQRVIVLFTAGSGPDEVSAVSTSLPDGRGRGRITGDLACGGPGTALDRALARLPAPVRV